MDAGLSRPPLVWLPGFRSRSWWKRSLAAPVYAFLLLAIAVDVVSGAPGTGIWVVVLGLVLAVPYALTARDRLQARQPPVLRAFTIDTILFPHCHFDLHESGLRDQRWRSILEQAGRRGGRVVFLPAIAGNHFGYGTECAVSTTPGIYRFNGLRRVRLLDQRSRPGEVSAYRVQPLVDIVTPQAAAMAGQVVPLVRAWLRAHPERAWASGIDQVGEPAVVGDIACMVLFEREPQRAPILGVDDVAERLRLCADYLAALGFTPPPPAASTAPPAPPLPPVASPPPAPSPPSTPAPPPVPAPQPASRSAPAPYQGALGRYSRDLVAEARAGKLKPIFGRDEQIGELETVLAKLDKSSAILVGEPGVGKTAIVEGLATRIAAGDCAPRLLGRPLRALDLTGLVAGTTLRGMFEERLQVIITEAIATRAILFIDEIHGLVGAGDRTGGMDAANIIKPAVASGDLTVIGATTRDEYHRYIEKDGALKRRFSLVAVPTPNVEATIGILENQKGRFLDWHGLAGIDDDAIEAIVRLSDRYVADRSFPDKALDLLDEICASEGRRRPGEAAVVDRTAVTSFLAKKWGVAAQDLDAVETARLLGAATYLRARIIGQEPAIQAVVDAVVAAYGGIRDAERPIASLLFDGPPGVGKTELARALADFLFPGRKDSLVRLDMTEFKDRYMVAALTGAPPGYIGSEKEGRLTGLIKRSPHCVLLLDEIDKAAPEVRDILLQIFEGARLRDSSTGEVSNFSEVLIVMTSNVGYRALDAAAAREEHFGAPLMSRVEVVEFAPLTAEEQRRVVELALDRLARRALEARRIRLEFAPDVVDFVRAATFDASGSGREMVNTVRRQLETPLNRLVLEGGVPEGARVLVQAREDGLEFENVPAEAPSEC